MNYGQGIALFTRRVSATQWLIVLLLLSLHIPAGATAVPMLNSIGKLRGAYNVEVLGKIYDVHLGGSTCFSSFDGCDDVSDFAFQTEADATAAAEALLNQVFIDSPAGNFGFFPQATQGCDGDGSSPQFCSASTPFGLGVSGFGPTVSTVDANNRFGNGLEDIRVHHGATYASSTNLNDDPFAVWARWMEVDDQNAQLTTGSPATIARGFLLPLGVPLQFSFDYQFLGDEGELTVMLGSDIIATIPAVAGVDFTNYSAILPALTGVGSDVFLDLKFSFDAATAGEVLWLDNILIGTYFENFNDGELIDWLVPDGGNVAVVEAAARLGTGVPVPGPLALIVSGMVLLFPFGSLRRSYPERNEPRWSVRSAR